MLRTDLLALATAYAGSLTGLHGNGTLVFVDTLHIDATALDTFLAQLNDVARTSLGTGSTSCTAVFIHFWKTCFGIHVDCVKLASRHTVATTETAEAATGLTGSTGIHCRATAKAVIGHNLLA